MLGEFPMDFQTNITSLKRRGGGRGGQKWFVFLTLRLREYFSEENYDLSKSVLTILKMLVAFISVLRGHSGAGVRKWPRYFRSGYWNVEDLLPQMTYLTPHLSTLQP